MDRSTSSGDEDVARASNSYHRDERNNDGRRSGDRYHHTYHNNSRGDYDTRSQSSHKSEPNSETSTRGDPTTHNYNPSANESVGSYGSGGGGGNDSTSRGFPLHGHVHFRHATISATHLLNGDPAHQFPPSLYQSSADAPKSDTATVCSGSMLEDIEDVGSITGSHYDGDSSTTSHYPPGGGNLRRSNSKEGNRLVDFAERSQAVFPKQSKSSGGHTNAAAGTNTGTLQELSMSNVEEEGPAGAAAQHKKGMGPPLSRHWLLQYKGISPYRTGSVKSGDGSDVVVNVGSDCGGSLTDVQSVLSQEDAAMLTTANSEISSDAPPPSAAAKMEALDTTSNDTSTNTNTNSATAASAPPAEEEKKPHPLLCDQSGSNKSGRVSPGGTIYRGRGVRRYKGRFYALPLKRFHQDGVHLHSDSEPEGSTTSSDRQMPHQSRSHNSSSHHHQQHPEGQRHEDGVRDHDYGGNNYRDNYQRDGGGGDNHNYYGHSSSSRHRDRSRSRSRSRSPPRGDRRREARTRHMDQTRGYKIEKK